MRSLRALAASSVGVGSIMAGGLSGSALAQDAVQWRIEDGGNGHWYEVTLAPMSWSAARDLALSLGGDLSSIESRAEMEWLDLELTGERWPNQTCHVGGRQDPGSPSVSSGWRWLSGDLVDFSQFDAYSFDDWPGGGSWGYEDGEQDYLHAGGFFRYLGDVNDVPWPPLGSPDGASLIEWSADCNADGIVDYGQIRAGELVDVNTNNIPDCCEQGSSCEINLLLNGGFESGPVQTDCTWVVHPAGSSFVPGWSVIAVSVDRERLSTACPLEIESWQSFEGEFTIDLDGAAAGGAIAQSVATQPGRRYRLTFQLTGNCALGTKRMRVEIGSLFQEFEHVCASTNPQPWSKKSIEFEATVASTTIVLRSLLTDGGNGPVIDDVRLVQLEDTCLADIDESGAVNAVDLAAILTVWGTSGGKYPRADINNDGEVNGPDLAAVLSAWGPCP